MRDLSNLGPLQNALHAIDEANAHDPNSIGGAPLAQRQGVLASGWLDKLDPDPSAELRLATRAHHLRRWELARADYPEGRQGYLRWRRENKAHQADSLATIMAEHDWDDAGIERARTLLNRTRLRSDPETQTLEDVACLVFLETQFDDMASRTEHDHLVSIVAKTLKKMSPTAVSLASSISLSPGAQSVLNEAATNLV